MQFCENCGARVRPKQIESDGRSVVVLACNDCGQLIENKPKETGFLLKKEETTSSSINVLEGSDIKTMPTTEVECPKCEHNEAFWWFLQTRSGDEPATQFFRCIKCKHTWRFYS